ncbi:MAG: hypothetical protein RL660_1252 [Bacteroidota bacterium]|jgi:hypothetical protein
MKNSTLIILIISLIQFSKTALGQTTSSIDSLLCKEWKLVSYKEGGEKFPPSSKQKNDRMIFYNDHKVKSIETGNIQNGIWQYDATKKALSVVDNKTKEKAIMKVLKITKDECILEYTDPEGTSLKIYMVPVSK